MLRLVLRALAVLSGLGLPALTLVACGTDRPLAPTHDPDFARGGSSLQAPSNLASTPASANLIDLVWQDNSTSESSFEVHRSTAGAGGPFALLTTIGADVTTYGDGGLSASTQYCYAVRAVAATSPGKPKSSAFSSTSCATTLTAPAAPSALQATAGTGTTIQLSWTDNSGDETGFNIERCQGNECTDFAEVAQVGPTVTSWADKALSASTTYRYRVRSRGNAGFSEYSNTASATTSATAPPEAASGTNATPPYSSTVDITWVDNSTVEDGFRVERSLDGGSTWVTVRTMSRNATSSSEYGVASEQQRCYRVVAFNAHGDATPSSVDCTTPPAAPTNLTATASGPQTIDLTWTENSAVEESYEVQRWDGGGAPYHVIAELPANSTTYRDAGAPSDITVHYIVRAKKDGGGSSYSNVASVAAALTPPNAPLAADARPIGSTWITVVWTDNSANEDGFRVERSTDSEVTWETATSMSPYDFIDGGRTSDQRVCYRVIAFNSRGDSPPSNTDCTAPPAAPTNFTATSSAEGIDLAWTDNSTVEDGYEVWAVTTCSVQSEYLLASLPPNSTAYRYTGDPDLFPCSILNYYLVATKDNGYSDAFYVPAP